MALLSNIAGTEQVALTKINACITTVNLFGGGAVGKIATKSSANDFDIFYAENAFNQKSTTSLAIGTGNKDFDIGGSQWDDDFNFRVRAFSIASPGNYMEGTISALISGYGVKTWRMVVDTVVGSGTFADWQFQVLADTVTTNSAVAITGTSSNDIVSAISVTGGGTLSTYSMFGIKRGDIVNLSGYLRVNVSGSTYQTTIITLQDKWLMKNMGTITQNKPASGFYLNTSDSLGPIVCPSYLFNNSSTQLTFVSALAVPVGKTFFLFFDVTYQAKDFSI
jgi:hypothetical protein